MPTIKLFFEITRLILLPLRTWKTQIRVFFLTTNQPHRSYFQSDRRTSD